MIHYHMNCRLLNKIPERFPVSFRSHLQFKANMTNCIRMNILVLNKKGSSLTEEIRNLVDSSKYVVYSVPPKELETSAWRGGCRLLVVNEEPPAELESSFEKFIQSGGSILRLKDHERINVRKLLESENILVKEDLENKQSIGEEIQGSFMSSSRDAFLQHPNIQKRLNNNRLLQNFAEWRFDEEPSADDRNSKYLIKSVNSCSFFKFTEYMNCLDTREIGRNLVHFTRISSSMVLLEGPPLVHGLTVVPDEQTAGKGRGGNAWVSPLGCAMFSQQLHLDTASPLGKKPSLIQHLVGLAVVQALRSFKNDLDVRLKWPNDIYYKSQAKLGGVIVNSSFSGSKIVVNVGCGLNLDNSAPTLSVNQLLDEAGVRRVAREEYLAQTFNRLEKLIDMFNEGKSEEVFQMYYDCWLHTAQKITVQTDSVSSKSKSEHSPSGDQVDIVGLDPYGYLCVRDPTGEVYSVYDDGNSFDMLEGLIRPKRN